MVQIHKYGWGVGMMFYMNYLVVSLPDGYGERLDYIANEIGVSVDYLVRYALEHSYIMTEEQRKMIDNPLPF